MNERDRHVAVTVPDDPEAALHYHGRARAIVLADASDGAKRVALAMLVAEIGDRLEGVSWWFAREAVWRASRAFVYGQPEPLVEYRPPRWITEPRSLRAAGLETCDRCYRVLPAPTTSAQLESVDRAAWSESLSALGLAGSS